MMKNYVSTVLSKIKSRTQRNQIGAELQSHIEDRIDYYVNAGYDLETATEKANAHMGDTAELVGEQLNSMTDSKFHKELTILFILLDLGAFYVFGLFYFLGVGLGMRETISGLIISSGFLLITFAELLIALRIKESFLASCSSVMLIIHGLLSFGFTPFVFCFYEIIIGKGNAFGEMYSHLWKCDNAVVSVLNIVFIVLSLVLSVCVFVHITMYNRLKIGKRFYKFEKYSKIIILVLSAVILSVTAFVYCADATYSDVFTEQDMYEGFYLVESDEIVDPKTIENYDDKQIRYHYQLLIDDEIETECISYEEQYEWHGEDDWDEESYEKNYPIQNSELIISYQKYDDMMGNVKYKTEKIVADFYTDKKYVMIVPMLEKERETEEDEYEYYPDFSKGEWIDASKKTVVKTKDREYRHSEEFLEYEITIVPKSY